MNCTGSDSIIIIIENDLSLNALLSKIDIHIYPNPSNGLFNLTIKGIDGQAKLEILNQDGKKLYFEELNLQFVSNKKIHLPQNAGIYYINLITPKGTYSKKLILE